MQLGECFVGEGVNAAHVNTVLGARMRAVVAHGPSNPAGARSKR